MSPNEFLELCTSKYRKKKCAFGSRATKANLATATKVLDNDVIPELKSVWRVFDGFSIGASKNSPFGEFSLLSTQQVSEQSLKPNEVLASEDVRDDVVILGADADGYGYLVWRAHDAQFLYHDYAKYTEHTLGRSINAVLDFIVSEFLKDKERYGVFYSTDGTGRNTKRMRDQKFVPDAEPSASNLFCNASDTAVWSVETITTTNAQGRLVTYSRLRRQAEPSPSCLKILKSAEEITCVGGLTDTCAMLFVRQPEGCFQLLRAEVDELRRCKTDVIKEFKSEFIIPSWKTELVVIDGTLYFVLNRREGGVELWRTDGTKKGTKKVKKFKNRCHSLVVRRGKLYFVGG